MWKDVTIEQLVEASACEGPPRSREEVEEIVELERLHLYNQGHPCGPAALRRRLDLIDRIRPLPSERTIARILARRGLTHGRTGWYPGEQPEQGEKAWPT
jgi:hypothetical protein